MNGFDEDFLGTCFDDNDFIERLQLNGAVSTKVAGRVVHLFHQRPVHSRGPNRVGWLANKNLYESRKGILVRNLDKEWGKF
jgi:hypothetical protein